MVAVLLFMTAARAGDDFKIEPGFHSLFNGKDLTGWYHKNAKEDLDGKTESTDKRFEWKEGILIVHPGKGTKDLYTKKEFAKDFHFIVEFRAAPRADSGVYVRGPQLQVRDYPTVGPYKNLKNFKNGDWNVLDIVVQGTTATCKCNGELLTDTMKVPAKGGIGLQGESGKFEFRRARIKELN